MGRSVRILTTITRESLPWPSAYCYPSACGEWEWTQCIGYSAIRFTGRSVRSRTPVTPSAADG
jgi:hypothetical protein